MHNIFDVNLKFNNWCYVFSHFTGYLLMSHSDIVHITDVDLFGVHIVFCEHVKFNNCSWDFLFQSTSIFCSHVQLVRYETVSNISLKVSISNTLASHL